MFQSGHQNMKSKCTVQAYRREVEGYLEDSCWNRIGSGILGKLEESFSCQGDEATVLPT